MKMIFEAPSVCIYMSYIIGYRFKFTLLFIKRRKLIQSFAKEISSTPGSGWTLIKQNIFKLNLNLNYTNSVVIIYLACLKGKMQKISLNINKG